MQEKTQGTQGKIDASKLKELLKKANVYDYCFRNGIMCYTSGESKYKTVCPLCSSKGLIVTQLPHKQVINCYNPKCRLKGDLITYFTIQGNSFFQALKFLCDTTNTDYQSLWSHND